MSDLSGMTLPGAVPAGREIALHEPSFETAIAAPGVTNVEGRIVVSL